MIELCSTRIGDGRVFFPRHPKNMIPFKRQTINKRQGLQYITIQKTCFTRVNCLGLIPKTKSLAVDDDRQKGQSARQHWWSL